MIFTPKDEMSMRHLFSTEYAQEILHLSYVGPILNTAGDVESSPDCIVRDRRSHPFKLLRCEFKFIPSSREDFKHNGQFDIAIIWSLPPGLSKLQLSKDLLAQNGCTEIIVLKEMKAFNDLLTYTNNSLSKLNNTDIDIIKKIVLRNIKNPASVFALCIAAQIYPEPFRIDLMVKLLATKYPDVKKMLPQGRSNIVSAFVQTNPPLITRMHGKFYRWTNKIDNETAADELGELIRTNFRTDVPSNDDLKFVIGGHL